MNTTIIIVVVSVLAAIVATFFSFYFARLWRRYSESHGLLALMRRYKNKQIPDNTKTIKFSYVYEDWLLYLGTIGIVVDCDTLYLFRKPICGIQIISILPQPIAIPLQHVHFKQRRLWGSFQTIVVDDKSGLCCKLYIDISLKDVRIIQGLKERNEEGTGVNSVLSNNTADEK